MSALVAHAFQCHFANSYTNDAYIAQQMIEFNQNHGIL